MVLETLDFSPPNQLTRLVAREILIIQSRRESYKSHMTKLLLSEEPPGSKIEFV
jgi:hypothetical protein